MLTIATKRRGWAFIVPAIALALVGSANSHRLATGATLLIIAAGCAAAGALWQVLYRRDLVDRLTYFAAAILAYAVVVGVLYGERVSDIPAEIGLGVGGIIAGLVYAEQGLRGRDARGRRGEDQLANATAD